MPRYDRSGHLFGTLRVGYVRFLRQELIAPHERVQFGLYGRVRLGALREQEAVPLYAHFETFLTPLRWLDSNYIPYVTGGVDSTSSLATYTPAGDREWDCLGIGDVSGVPIRDYFVKNYDRVFNEYFKWPEDTDLSIKTTTKKDETRHGMPAVQMESFSNRFRDVDALQSVHAAPTTTDTNTGKGGNQSGVLLEDIQRFGQKLKLETEREWYTSDRWRETISTLFDGKGSNEVDQVPYSLGGPNGWMTSENLWATDADGLGAIASVSQFDVAEDYGYITVPEHSVLAVAMVIRPQALYSQQHNPHANTRNRTREEVLGIPELIGARRPKQWAHRDYYNTTVTNKIGYAPFGHEWRHGWDQIDELVTDRNFLIQSGNVSHVTQARVIYDNAFVSSSLGNGLVRFRFEMGVDSDIPEPGATLKAGVLS